MKTTIQILYDQGFFDNYANADKVLEDFLYTTRHRGDLEDNTQLHYTSIVIYNHISV